SYRARRGDRPRAVPGLDPLVKEASDLQTTVRASQQDDCDQGGVQVSDNDRPDTLDPRDNLIGGLVSGQMGRDEFIKRAGIAGLSATAIGGMLVAAGKATAADEHAARGLAGGTV